MKKRLGLLAGIIVALGLATFGYFASRNQPTVDSLDSRPLLQATSEQAAVTSRLRSTRAVEREAVPQPQDLDPRVWNKGRMLNDYYKSLNESIRFYGRVIDSSDRPIEGAKVEVEIQTKKGDFLEWLANPSTRDKEYSPSRAERLTLLTDAQGRFSLVNRVGYRLQVGSLSKHGYVTRTTEGVFTGLERHLFRYGPEGDLDFAYRDPGTPETFRMWSSESAEPLVHQSVTVWLQESAARRFVNLISGEVAPAQSKQHDLMVELAGIPSRTDPMRKFEGWTLSLMANGGGFAAATIDRPFTAPASDYERIVSFTSTATNDLKWIQSRERRGFYLRSRDQLFSVLKLECDVHPWNGARLVIHALVNPHDSRNLEPDPTKQITDPEELRRLDLETNR